VFFVVSCIPLLYFCVDNVRQVGHFGPGGRPVPIVIRVHPRSSAVPFPPPNRKFPFEPFVLFVGLSSAFPLDCGSHATALIHGSAAPMLQILSILFILSKLPLCVHLRPRFAKPKCPWHATAIRAIHNRGETMAFALQPFLIGRNVPCCAH